MRPVTIGIHFCAFIAVADFTAQQEIIPCCLSSTFTFSGKMFHIQRGDFFTSLAIGTKSTDVGTQRELGITIIRIMFLYPMFYLLVVRIRVTDQFSGSFFLNRSDNCFCLALSSVLTSAR